MLVLCVQFAEVAHGVYLRAYNVKQPLQAYVSANTTQSTCPSMVNLCIATFQIKKKKKILWASVVNVTITDIQCFEDQM